MELWECDGVELLELYRRREATPHEVLNALARRTSSIDEQIGAFRESCFEQVAEEARPSSTGKRVEDDAESTLHGIPIAVKEIIDVAGIRTCFGSKLFEDRRPKLDAEVVSRLRNQGALVVGTTRSHEFAWGITTQNQALGGTKNPWNLRRVPGGSSGGSAAAVASGFCPIALGTDTGGSVRIPAAYCGVHGFKPSFGATPIQGVLPLSYSLDHVGFLARSIRDLRLIWNAIGDDSKSSLDTGVGAAERIRFGILPSLHDPSMSEHYARIFAAACRAIEGSGSEIVECSTNFTGLLESFAGIQAPEALYVHSVILQTFPGNAGEYGSDVRERLERACGIDLLTHIEARVTAREITRRVDALFNQVDVLMMPVAARGPSLVDDPDFVMHDGSRRPFRDVVMGYTVLQNLCGLPTCVVPAGTDEDGLPVGIQFTTSRGSDRELLRIVEATEKTLPGDEIRMPTL